MPEGLNMGQLYGIESINLMNANTAEREND